MAPRRAATLATAALLLSSLLQTGLAEAQAPPPAKPPPAAPPPAAPPPQKKVDTEFDPDAKPKEPPPLPPVEAGQWGVGGKDEEGRFAPGTKKKEEDAAARAKDKEEDKKPVDLGPARNVWLDTMIGFGAMRDITNDVGGNDNGRTSSSGVSFIAGFSWRVAEIWTLGARMGFIRGSLDGPAGPFNTFANGNLEVQVKPSFQLGRNLRLPAQISLFLPIGQGDFFPDQTAADKKVAIAQAQLNQFASYSRGWEEMPLFAPKRFGIRAGVGIVWKKPTSEATASATPALAGGLTIAADTQLDLMIRTGGGDAYAIAGNAFSLSSPTVAWTTRASVHYAFFDGKLEPGLRMWLTYASLPVYTASRDYSGAQFVLEPQVNGRFPVNQAKTMAVKAGLGIILPASGPLGGANAPFDASIKGFRINAAFEF